MELSGARVAVTGAGGFIGRAACQRLAAAGATVVGLEVDPSRRAGTEAAGAAFAQADTTEAATLGPALAGADAVLHAAGLVSEWGPLEDFVRVNVRGTANVIDAAVAAGARRIVHISSVAVFGYDHPRELAEDAQPRPCGIPYIDTKGASERLALERAAAGAPVTVVRPGDVYGPGSLPWTIRPLRLIRARRFVLPGRGEGLLVPVYVDDLVDALVRALTTEGVEGRAFTACGEPVPAADFFAHYARMLGRERVPSAPAPVVLAVGALFEALARLTGGAPDASRAAVTFLTRRAGYSTAQARELLGWEPRVDLEEGMRRTEAWARAEGLL